MVGWLVGWLVFWGMFVVRLLVCRLVGCFYLRDASLKRLIHRVEYKSLTACFIVVLLVCLFF